MSAVARRYAKALYDLANDPGETENLYASRPELVTSLRAALQRVQRGERR